ncbi:uncharacterized protein LOC129961948 isoform X3 [Argiope bruennichi]|uniref:uncharacterized protein LOC129961948 isoform X3 n=1 Tax=Argiope bruennichi TaxID=94029 RepID=UPI002494FCA0|nr:uncharacterized protein LOC129961948 isoform X3 [Argiope bruennichi]
MKYKLRNNANHGTWCSLLLPCCLFPFMIKFSSGIYILLFNICLCTLLVPIVQESKRNDYDWLRDKGYNLVLSIPPSLFIWHFFSYNFLLIYTLCLFGILCYNYLVKNLLIKCPGSFTYGEAQVISQGIMLFVLYSIATLLSKIVELRNFPAVATVPESVICLQILLLGCLLLVHTLCLIPSLRQGINFVFCCTTFSGIMMYAWHVTLKKDIFIWMWLYCLHDQKRMFRILNIPIIGPAIKSAFEVFLDEKDSGVLILTNIYLLIGCSSPIWLTGYISGTKGYHISLLSGIISVGFGDAAASMGGTFFGKHHWAGSNKTFEGSICAVVTQSIASFYFLVLGHELSLYNITIIIIAVLLTSLIEAKTTQVDNLVLPLFMFSFLCWIH